MWCRISRDSYILYVDMFMIMCSACVLVIGAADCVYALFTHGIVCVSCVVNTYILMHMCSSTCVLVIGAAGCVVLCVCIVYV